MSGLVSVDTKTERMLSSYLKMWIRKGEMDFYRNMTRPRFPSRRRNETIEGKRDIRNGITGA
jgi:hypothetical protein